MKKQIGLLLISVAVVIAYPSIASAHPAGHLLIPHAASQTTVLGTTTTNVSTNTPGMYISETLILKKDNQPLPGVIVTWQDQQGVTNEQGAVTFNNVIAGKQTLVTYYNHENRTIDVIISSPKTTVNYDAATMVQGMSIANDLFTVIGTSIVVILAVVLITYLMVGRTKRRKQTHARG